ncbi:MAG: tyrosine--tRNA ligase [Candidatus Omnitrophica bacterium]|nr:tyrosine--tRNA ligase [Candidatus Omnitrophota bacterium]MDD5311287.1 tyrosine--tRNA ligase [Candidatus Omnitrophota bacterium]MDD5546853.1 tyrosine--tRNA ligase [Candidatus Omnitrophota bacterium]
MDTVKQLEIIKRGAVEIINESALAGKLKKKKQLVIKAGFDPTAPDIHLGHTVLLRKLRHFQDLGHKVIFLIGDATALVGDPSGQNQARKVLTREEIEKNAKTYEKQVSKILKTGDKELFERMHNSSWFAKFGFEHLVQLAQRYTVARLLERDDFQKRLKEGKPISFLELFYPLMQGYDSVILDADIEIGGTDQKFNMLVGRDLQEAYGKEPQVVITMPLLVGTDGVQKMSKSYGNYIGINETAKEIFGKVMSVSDELMFGYYELLTDEDMQKVKAMHPMDAKKNLAYLIVKDYHGEEAAAAEKKSFEDVFQKRKDPADAPVKKLSGGPLSLNQVFDGAREEFKAMGIDSRSKLLSLLGQGAIKLDGEKVSDAASPSFVPGKRHLLKIGRHFLNVDLS